MKKIRNLISFTRYTLLLFREYMYDMYMYVRHSGHSPFSPRNKRNFYKIVIDVHTVEKGLSLKDCRPLFGQPRIKSLMQSLEKYDQTESEFPFEMATGALAAYVSFHRNHGFSDPFIEQVERFVVSVTQKFGIRQTGGVKEITDIYQPPRTAAEFLESRASCRMMLADTLSKEQIGKLVELAQKTPSQCNRQATKIHVYQDRALIESLLDLQAGARGFSERIGNLLVVTSEITAWMGINQRNQMYVDGGIFVMGILASAHALGLAACPLNLATTSVTEQKIKRLGKIPAAERLITMIAIGHVDQGPVYAAQSPRRNLNELMRFH